MTKKGTTMQLSSPLPIVSDQEEVNNVENGTCVENGTDIVKVKDETTNNPVSIYINKLNNYVERITTMNKELKELVNVGKSLEKDFNNIVKIMTKKNKNKTNGERRNPSGFAVASVLSDEMYEFLNITKGEKVPRKDVTRMMNDYITKNELRNPEDKRIILPNDVLKKIFNSNDTNTVTYFNLQSYIKHHFIKEQVVAAAAAAATVTAAAATVAVATK